MDINCILKEIIAEQLRIEPSDIGDYADVIEALGADSLDVVEILMSVEEQFNINVPDEDIPLLRTVSDMQAYIEDNI